MIPAERRLPAIDRLIERKHYFVVHAPRQTGKTTAFHTLARRLTAEGDYTALLTSCETGQSLEPDLEGSITALLETLQQNAEVDLPPELRPPAADPSLSPRTRLRELLVRWARESPRPLILFLDEIDALFDDALISVLRQLRSGYDHRPRGFPQSVALIGLRDVRDYLITEKPDADSGSGPHRIGTSSPFNIKVRSYVLRNFTAAEVAELYRQHTEETGQAWTDAAAARSFELTGGQPCMDLCVRWPLADGSVQRFAVELKVWRDTSSVDPVTRGKEQLAGYLARLGLDRGTLLVFDSRSDVAPLPERFSREEIEHGGKQILVLRL